MEKCAKTEMLTLSQQNKKRNYVASEPSYHTTKFFTENLLAIEIKIAEILMKKPVHLGLELSKTLMYEF